MELFERVEGAFDEGGLMDEGGTVDPISGNDVPIGSTQEEVRDDIPAQLSEGEFVFPADVVRYYGLETLMKMRQEAKQGLKLMEAMGQMGNSEEATIPDDIPFDINDLDMEDDGVLEYAQGGVVQAQQGTYVPPFVPTPDNQYGIAGFQTSQFAPRPINQPVYGGPVPMPQPPIDAPMPPIQPPITPPTTTPTPVYQVPTFTQLTGTAQPEPGGYDEMRTYVNDAGMEMQIPFKNGSPIYPIPEGYKVKGEAVKTTTDVKTETTQTAPEQQDSDDPSDPFEGKNTINLGGTVITKENVKTEGKTEYSSFKPGQVKGTTKYATGTASSKTRPTTGIVSGIKDTVTGLTNQDQRTLTDEFGTTIAMTQDLYDEIIGDRFGLDRQQMLDQIFEVQKGLDAKDGYSKDVDNRMAENLAKEYGIEYKGQSTAQLTVIDIPAAMEKAVKEEEKVRNDKIAKDKDVREKAEQRLAQAEAAGKSRRAEQERMRQEKAAEIAAEKNRIKQIQEQAARDQGGGDDNRSDEQRSADDYTASAVAEAISTGDYSRGFAKGGLAQQMKQSGLASKK